ncbi:hypothetical protein [Paraburkholderia sp. RL17-381-BIF-C]|uniref:hypothetical protein n=1 Tax=Paraburkholderia sp. RL17-381-BIF-C TaxID=3031635 RepID=UPI0038B91C10
MTKGTAHAALVTRLRQVAELRHALVERDATRTSATSGRPADVFVRLKASHRVLTTARKLAE